MAFSLAPFIGDGTEANPFRPDVVGPYAVIDLRGDATVADGWCLLTADTVPSGATDLGGLDVAPPQPVINKLQNELGVTLSDTSSLRAVIAELLILHGSFTDSGRWNPLRANRFGRHVIHLGGKVYDAPAPVGTVITESWTAADTSDGDISADLAWTFQWQENTGKFDISSNQIQYVHGGSNGTAIYRADTDLASDDHYAEAEVHGDSDSNNSWYTFARIASNTDVTCYRWRVNQVGSVFFHRIVNASFTELATDTISSVTPSGQVMRFEVDGSNLEGFFDGVSELTTTDTNITGNTRAGVGGSADSNGTLQLDNFEAGDLTTEDPANFQASVTDDDVTLTWDASF